MPITILDLPPQSKSLLQELNGGITQAHEAVHVKQLEARIVDIEKHFKDTYGVESCYRTASERDDAMNWAQKAVGAPLEYTPHDMPMTDAKLNSEADAIKAEWEVYKRKYENSNE